MRIKQLPSIVANQIAAGEVIERPASVVKELLENAYDAKADSILIEIGYGGLNQIKISDNGTGIVEEDLPLTISAHATSKISEVNDLNAIRSMGFRGEALASIASIAKLTISSKPESQKNAMMLEVKGEQHSITPCARSLGTTIDVRDIFFNIPVRKRFLKPERTEFLAIESVVRRFAMSAPYISIQLKHNNKPVLDLPAARDGLSQQKRMTKLMGSSFVKQAIEVDIERSGMLLKGWISGGHYQRSQNDRQWVYINQRMVRDKLLYHAIKRAYEGILHPGRFPSCLLYFQLPFTEVDVNVHPAKHEVRFQQPRLVHDFFVSQISEALQQEDKETSSIDASKETNQAEIREPQEKSYQTPCRPSLKQTSFSSSSWQRLNSRYAIIYFSHEPYIVDIKSAYQKFLKQAIEEKPMPLPERFLLVPMSYDVSENSYSLLKKHSSLFAQLGIHYELSSNKVIFKALPVDAPQLDIAHFLEALENLSEISEKCLLSLLLNHQSFSMDDLSQEEKAGLQEYLQEGYNKQPFSKQLTEKNCRLLFDE